MQKVIEWIDDVIKGSSKTLQVDIQKVLSITGKGKFDTEGFYDLLMELRDNQRDIALLSLIKDIILEESKQQEKCELKGALE